MAQGTEAAVEDAPAQGAGNALAGEAEVAAEGQETDSSATASEAPAGESPRITAEGAPEPAETPEEGAAARAAAPPPPGAVLTALKAAGIRHNYADETAAIQGAIEAKRRIGEREEMAEVGRQLAEEYLPHRDAFQEWRKSQEEAKRVGPGGFNPPPWNEEDGRQLQVELQQAGGPNAEGAWDKVSPDLRNRYMSREAYIQTHWDRWMRDPNQMVEDFAAALQPHFDRWQRGREKETQLQRILTEKQTVIGADPEKFRSILREIWYNPVAIAVRLAELEAGKGRTDQRASAAEGRAASVAAREADLARLSGRTRPAQSGEAVAARVPVKGRSTREVVRDIANAHGVNE